ncbi:hypothetical protein GW17_00017345 [Ensete ventricosum]|nr:hypothetical protein GW17_00017345 [Ensete ventricosum]
MITIGRNRQIGVSYTCLVIGCDARTHGETHLVSVSTPGRDSDDVVGARREFAKSSPKVIGKLAGSMSEVHRKMIARLARSLSEDAGKLAGS